MTEGGGAKGPVACIANTGLYRVSTQEARARMNFVRLIGLLGSMAWIVYGPWANAGSLGDAIFRNINWPSSEVVGSIVL